MTVCIAAICEEGTHVILATDTMVTNPGIPIEFEHPSKKMTPLAQNCVARTAGDALAHSELFAMARSHVNQFRDPSVDQVVVTIKECYQKVRKNEVRERILLPRGFNNFGEFYEIQRVLMPEIAAGIQAEIDMYDYGLSIVVGGTTGHSGHIYGVINPGTSQCYDAISFHAIGTGSSHALNTLIAKGCSSRVRLPDALMMVLEAKMTAENAPGVGSTTDMVIMSPGEPGELVNIPRPSIQKMRDLHQNWVRQDPSWEKDLETILEKKDDDTDGKPKSTEAAGVQEKTGERQTSVPDTSSEVRGLAGHGGTGTKKTKTNRK